jgi:hypothetical protein
MKKFGFWGSSGIDDLLVLYGGFGSVMSAIWGATFCKLYVWFKADTDKTG